MFGVSNIGSTVSLSGLTAYNNSAENGNEFLLFNKGDAL